MALLKGLITRLGEIVKKKYFQNQEVGLLHQPSPLNELSLSAAPILGPPSSHSPCSTYLNLNRFFKTKVTSKTHLFPEAVPYNNPQALCPL